MEATNRVCPYADREKSQEIQYYEKGLRHQHRKSTSISGLSVATAAKYLDYMVVSARIRYHREPLNTIKAKRTWHVFIRREHTWR